VYNISLSFNSVRTCRSSE